MERAINKMKYRKKDGQELVYSYYITITKKEIESAGIDPNKKANITVEGNKIIITK